MENQKLNKKTAIVTGAGRGIGRAIAIALADRGTNVIAAARTGSEIAGTANEIRSKGGSAHPITVNLAEEKSIRSLFSQTKERFGTLDILINNAGIGLFGLIQDFSSEDLQKLLDVNVRGTFLCCQEAMQLMVPQRSGTIINISSVVGFKGYAKQSGYTASKHAIVGMTKSLASEAQEHNIRVSVINPGGTATSLISKARPDLDPSILMQPEDIAQAVIYLLSLSERCAVDEIYIRRRNSKPF